MPSMRRPEVRTMGIVPSMRTDATTGADARTANRRHDTIRILRLQGRTAVPRHAGIPAQRRRLSHRIPERHQIHRIRRTPHTLRLHSLMHGSTADRMGDHPINQIKPELRQTEPAQRRDRPSHGAERNPATQTGSYHNQNTTPSTPERSTSPTPATNHPSIMYCS